MSTTPYPGPDEVIIPSRIYFDEGKRIDVKVWPKTIQLTGPTKDLTKGADDQYYDYSPSQVEAILFGILQLTPEHQDIIVIDLKKHLKSFIQDKDQAEEMITQYTCYYNAIKRWESNHKETEILHQLEISNLLEQLKNN